MSDTNNAEGREPERVFKSVMNDTVRAILHDVQASTSGEDGQELAGELFNRLNRVLCAHNPEPPVSLLVLFLLAGREAAGLPYFAHPMNGTGVDPVTVDDARTIGLNLFLHAFDQFTEQLAANRDRRGQN